MVFEPYGASFTSAFDSTGATLNTTITSLRIGKAGSGGTTQNSANVTLANSSVTSGTTTANSTKIAGPIRVYGGNITVSQYANLTSTAAGKGIMLKATGNITSNSDVNYTTNAGDITFWSDSDGSGAGYIYVYDRNIIDSRTNANRTSGLISTASGGGTLTLGGGSASTTLTSALVLPLFQFSISRKLSSIASGFAQFEILKLPLGSTLQSLLLGPATCRF